MILSKVIAEKCKEKWALEGEKNPLVLQAASPTWEDWERPVFVENEQTKGGKTQVMLGFP